MRAFNSTEKDIIRKLVHLRSEYDGDLLVFLEKYVYDQPGGAYVSFIPSASELELSVPRNEDFDKNVDEDEEPEKFYELLALILYLKDERFISLFRPGADDISEEFSLGERLDGRKYATISLGSDCYNLVSDIFRSHVYISEDLKELVRDNFQTREEKRFAKQVRLTWAALVVAISVGVIGIILQTFLLFNK